jgi:hypothetical protein
MTLPVILFFFFQTPQGNLYRGLIPNPELVVMACHVAPSETPLSLSLSHSLCVCSSVFGQR